MDGWDGGEGRERVQLSLRVPCDVDLSAMTAEKEMSLV